MIEDEDSADEPVKPVVIKDDSSSSDEEAEEECCRNKVEPEPPKEKPKKVRKVRVKKHTA